VLSELKQQAAFRFEILYQSTKSRARVGRIVTPHGVIDTPNFVGVGTNGSMKAIANHEVDRTLNLQLMFCNTYHLMVQPGAHIVKAAGGLHKFIGRNQPIITDSGGFQVFSLAYGPGAKELKGQSGKKHPSSIVKINEDGVLFRSYRDGSLIFLSPETSVLAQKDIGADIIIPLDELLPFHVSEKKLQASFERTHRWELRSLQTHLENPQQQAMYAVVHGGADLHLRQMSCSLLTQHPFDGYAIGGSLGSDHAQLFNTVAGTTPHLPLEKPIHLLGIGDSASMVPCIEQGVDTFDSAYPTKIARHGLLLTKKGPLKIIRQDCATQWEPIEAGCECSTCQNYTRGYLHHLFKAKEPIAATLASTHNLHFMIQWMQQLRMEILCGLL
jgi:queuine tRNA-ribosyltransferase